MQGDQRGTVADVTTASGIVLGFGISAVMLALGFLIGVRVGLKRGQTIVFTRSPRMDLANSVSRTAGPGPARSWQEPDWSRAAPPDSPGASSLPSDDS